MPPRKERGPGPSIDGTEAKTLFHDATEYEGKSEYGVPAPFYQLRPRPSFVMVRIEPRPDGMFRPTESGQWAVTLGVDDCEGRLIDFVAYFLNAPGRWWLRRNEIPILGAEAISRAEFSRRPLSLYETPHAWLLARGRGAVVLDWGCDLHEIFKLVPRIHCQSAGLKDRLRRSFWKSLPKITAPRKEMRHAA